MLVKKITVVKHLVKYCILPIGRFSYKLLSAPVEAQS